MKFIIKNNKNPADSVFMSLALLIWGNEHLHGEMRNWIVRRMRARRHLYHRDEDYCESMSQKGTPGTFLEFQVASDIFFTTIDIYTLQDSETPQVIIKPKRAAPLLNNACTNRISIW